MKDNYKCKIRMIIPEGTIYNTNGFFPFVEPLSFYYHSYTSIIRKELDNLKASISDPKKRKQRSCIQLKFDFVLLKGGRGGKDEKS